MAETIPTVVTVAASSLTAGRREGDPPLAKAEVRFHVMQPLTIVLVRGLRTFLQTLLGTLSAGMVGVLPVGDFYHLMLMSASVSVASGVISLIQNLIELLGKFDQSHPNLTV